MPNVMCEAWNPDKPQGFLFVFRNTKKHFFVCFQQQKHLRIVLTLLTAKLEVSASLTKYPKHAQGHEPTLSL